MSTIKVKMTAQEGNEIEVVMDAPDDIVARQPTHAFFRDNDQGGRDLVLVRREGDEETPIVRLGNIEVMSNAVIGDDPSGEPDPDSALGYFFLPGSDTVH